MNWALVSSNQLRWDIGDEWNTLGGSLRVLHQKHSANLHAAQHRTSVNCGELSCYWSIHQYTLKSQINHHPEGCRFHIKCQPPLRIFKSADPAPSHSRSPRRPTERGQGLWWSGNFSHSFLPPISNSDFRARLRGLGEGAEIYYRYSWCRLALQTN